MSLVSKWHSKEARLSIHWQDGFTLKALPPGMLTQDAAEVVWSHPFQQLRKSGDDGKKILWLDFGNGPLVSLLISIILQCGVKLSVAQSGGNWEVVVSPLF